MTTFYVLEYACLGPKVVDVTYKHVTCSLCGTRAVARVGGVGVRFTKKSELADVCRTAQGILVRHAVVDHLIEARMSGWRPGCVRVETVPRLEGQDLEYYELVVIGRTGGYSEHVALEPKSECRECGRQVFVYPRAGLVIPEECWDRSDIFVIDELPGILVVTEPFRNVIEKHKHTGVEFVAIEEWRDWP